jgi:prepilin signal peptidase PulO-like enzyme (type II secretory pathway)
MQNLTNLLPITPSLDQLARIIANVAAPAFLLGAVAAFISVLISRINRIVDRAQLIQGVSDNSPSKSSLAADLTHLRRRATLLNRALFCAILSAILTALIIIVAFVSAMFHVAHEYGVAVLFIGSLVLFCVSLIDLARETRIALRDIDLHV